ncbi:MAG: acylphosphatase [Rhodospirillaceae bacterium]|nr:acylphosphatase [Rhodospirillaceae bacterium]|tara:strand:- start:4372 stop:4656 length:285 start_codon:yes stop_codon:yes gene_type:complete
MTDRRAVHVSITGRVQGVWYRAWTAEEASDLGIDGWVRNRRDGTVEAVFAGVRKDVETMLMLCRSGPPLAWVDRLHIEEYADDVGTGFEQRQTI